MMEWLNSNISYWHWLVFGFSLMIVEMLLLSFVTLWFGLAAVIVGIIVALLPVSFSLQILLWVILSIVIIYFWFKKVLPYFKNKACEGKTKDSIIGQTGLVIDYHLLAERRGRLRFSVPILGGDEWDFISNVDVEVGQRVIVKGVDNNILTVSSK